MGDVVVFGGTGRLGRLLGEELRERGASVTTVGRGRAGAPDVVADVEDPDAITQAAAGHRVAVSVLTPASEPEELARIDPERLRGWFVRVADGLVGSGVERLVVVGLASTLLDEQGRPLYEDPTFPDGFRAFARAHQAGLDRLRETAGAVSWSVLTPPMQLDPDGPRTGLYRLAGEGVEPIVGSLSYADLAVAVADQVGSDGVTGRVSVWPGQAPNDPR